MENSGRATSRRAKTGTREKILASALKLMEGGAGAAGVTMRSVAAGCGITAMAIYKHFPDRAALLQAVVAAEYARLSKYFERANARTEVKGLRGMLGYLEYAYDHPALFAYMFAATREGAFTYPADWKAGKSPTLNILQGVVARLMADGILAPDDVLETSLAIWAHAHGLVMLYLSGRIGLSRANFTALYMRSLTRLLDGLCARGGGSKSRS
jgi:AcrR family transcriptional regulator